MSCFPLEMAGYGVVYADPPWKFENFSKKGQKKGAAEHYDCMPTDAICALRGSLGLDFVCAEHSVLILWGTFPMLPDALRVVKEWGFTYKTGGSWFKRTTNGLAAFGTGYLYRGASEIWLLGTRGNPAILSHSERNLIDAKVRGHSRKPDDMYAKIERQFHGRYLELFARQRRTGWDAWGNQVDKFEAAA